MKRLLLIGLLVPAMAMAEITDRKSVV